MSRRSEEVFRLPVAPAGPFGEPQAPWYKRRANGAPRPLMVPVGLLSPPLAGVASSGLHGANRVVVIAAVLVLPSWVLESCWRAARRRRNDELLPTGEHL